MQIEGPYSLAISAGEVAAATRSIVDDILPRAPRRGLISWLAGLAWRMERGSIELLLHQWRRRHFFMERHLDSAVVRQLCSDPRLREQLAARLGEDMLLWRSEVWVSRPDDCLIPAWHHDAYPFLTRGAGRTINAYIALTDVDSENGFEYLPPSLAGNRSLEKISVDRYSGNAFLRVPTDLEESAVQVRLDAGEFVLFSDDLIHRSVRNTTSRTRVSLALRIATASLRILRGYSSSFGPVAL